METDKKRFLRDHTLNKMLEEIKVISDRVSQNKFPPVLFYNSLSSLTEMYETNMVILQHLEDAIEQLRKEKASKAAIESVVEAAVHVQLGLMSIHNALKEDIGTVMEGIMDIKQFLGMKED